MWIFPIGHFLRHFSARYAPVTTLAYLFARVFVLRPGPAFPLPSFRDQFLISIFDFQRSRRDTWNIRTCSSFFMHRSIQFNDTNFVSSNLEKLSIAYLRLIFTFSCRVSVVNKERHIGRDRVFEFCTRIVPIHRCLVG